MASPKESITGLPFFHPLDPAMAYETGAAFPVKKPPSLLFLVDSSDLNVRQSRHEFPASHSVDFLPSCPPSVVFESLFKPSPEPPENRHVRMFSLFLLGSIHTIYRENNRTTPLGISLVINSSPDIDRARRKKQRLTKGVRRQRALSRSTNFQDCSTATFDVVSSWKFVVLR